MKNFEGFRRKIEQFLSFQRGGVETIKDFLHVSLVTFQKVSETGDEFFPLLLVSRFDHHQQSVKSHELARIFLIELCMPLLTGNQITAAGDKLHLPGCIESG